LDNVQISRRDVTLDKPTNSTIISFPDPLGVSCDPGIGARKQAIEPRFQYLL
jgi:hypothetical protein